MSVPLTPIDTSAYQVGTTGRIDWTNLVPQGGSVGTAGRAMAHVRILNESGCGILVQLQRGAGDHVPAGGWLDLAINGDTFATYTVEYVLAGPSPNLILVTVYEPGERVPALPVLGNSPVGVGGTVKTSAGTSIQNDGNGPGTQIIEATPSDQAASAIQVNNDGSGSWKILSAGVLRTLLSIVRGNASTGHAVVDIGDAADKTAFTYHGSIGSIHSDNNTISSDGAGNLTAASFVGNLAANHLAAGTAPAGVDLTSINSDGGDITSDGVGTLTVNPTTPGTAAGVKVGAKGAIFHTDQGGSLELGAGNQVNPGATQTPYIDFHTTASARDFDARILAENGSNTTDGQGYLVFRGALFGFIQGAGSTRICQIGAIPGHGAGDMAISGSTYWTTQASAGYNNSASFTAFDVAEVYATDREYPDGTLVCPGDDGRMTRCTHDGCHAALVVSKAPALGIGDPLAIMRETGETCELLALVGRMRVQASGPVAARQLVTSDGAGGVRAMRPGEAGYALGYALAAGPGTDGTAGILIRPQYCIAPADR